MQIDINQSAAVRSAVVIMTLSLSACAGLKPTRSISDHEIRPDYVQRHFYAGMGIGPSFMEPDASEVNTHKVNDRVANGGQLTLGMDINKRFAVELHSADIGSAGFSPNGRINYHIHGASGLLYAGKNRHNFKRRGFSGYGRLGLGMMENSPIGDINYVQDNKTHLLFGAGLEYMLPMGLGIRAEGFLFDLDARYAQLALIFRTGRKKERRRVEIVKAPEPAPVVAPVPAIPVPAIAVVKQPPAPVVQEDNCSDVTGVLEGVNFYSDSDELTDTATSILDVVANRLADCESVAIQIDAHTDSQGAAQYNINLSKRRAVSVARYLVSRNIEKSLLRPRAFGETRPIDDNSTAVGRKRNRRVEITVFK